MLALGLFCAELLACVLLDVSIIWALLIGLVLFCIYAKARHFSWRAIVRMIGSGIGAAKNILIVFLLIGILTALWRACGTLPYIICCAVRLIHPGSLLLMTFLLNCGVSVLTGTSFGTAATMGAICMSVAVSMGMDPLPVGGAILAGAYFGDRCSPVSTSALLVSELTGTDLYQNIRRMLHTAAVPFLLTCAVYAVIGFSADAAGEAADLQTLFSGVVRLHWLTLLPAVLILLLSALRVNVKRSMLASIAAAVLLCLLLQRTAPAAMLRFAVLGYTAAEPAAAALLNGGGVVSMLRVAAIVCISSAYSGIFQETGMLLPLKRCIARLSGPIAPFGAMLCTSVVTGLVACNQTLTILLTHQLCADTEDAPEETALDLENTAVVVAPLVPWSIAGAAPLSSAGAPTASILLACFLYLLPLTMLLRSFRNRARQRRQSVVS